ncbi:MAG: hypothetical protein ABR951_10040 [Candidatus Aminicenantales bacterium]|jgi:hypothetical protein
MSEFYRGRYAEAFARFTVETLEAWVAHRPDISSFWKVPRTDRKKGDGKSLVAMTREVWGKQLGREVTTEEAERIIFSFQNFATVLKEIESEKAHG